MDTSKPTILVTGVSGNLGCRLIEHLPGYAVVGMDLTPPAAPVDRFLSLDLGREESTRHLHLLLREVQPVAVVHLAFVIDPQRTGMIDLDRMWQINVAGTARVMEAITEANRAGGKSMEAWFAISFFPAASPPTVPICPQAVTEEAPCTPTPCLTPFTKKRATWSCSNVRLAPWLWRFHSPSSHFCGRYRRKLSDGSFSRHTQRQGRAGRAHASGGQAPALHAAVWTTISGQQNPVRPRR